jgi:hypothetical protein
MCNLLHLKFMADRKLPLSLSLVGLCHEPCGFIGRAAQLRLKEKFIRAVWTVAAMRSAPHSTQTGGHLGLSWVSLDRKTCGHGLALPSVLLSFPNKCAEVHLVCTHLPPPRIQDFTIKAEIWEENETRKLHERDTSCTAASIVE